MEIFVFIGYLANVMMFSAFVVPFWITIGVHTLVAFISYYTLFALRGDVDWALMDLLIMVASWITPSTGVLVLIYTIFYSDWKNGPGSSLLFTLASVAGIGMGAFSSFNAVSGLMFHTEGKYDSANERAENKEMEDEDSAVYW